MNKNWEQFTNLQDPYNPQNYISGYITHENGKLYGAVMITAVNNQVVLNPVTFCTPKLRYPYGQEDQLFGQDRTYDSSIFKKVKELRHYEKLDGCIHGDTLVTLSNGERIPIRDIKIGYSILTFDEKTDEFITTQVLKILQQESQKEWIRLDFENNNFLICTIDHLILTKKGWIEAQHLSEEDEIIST